MSQKLFTLEEANGLIPRLEIAMQKLQIHTAAVRDAVAENARATGQPVEELTASQLVELRPQLRPTIEAMEQVLQDIDACGGQFKGLDLGLVDFPAEINGEIVLLCWQYGEKEIAYYHTPESGFGGRQALFPKHERLRYLQ